MGFSPPSESLASESLFSESLFSEFLLSEFPPSEFSSDSCTPLIRHPLDSSQVWKENIPSWYNLWRTNSISVVGNSELHCRGRCRFNSCPRPIRVTWQMQIWCLVVSTLWCSLFVADLIMGMEELELHCRCGGRSDSESLE